MRIGSAQINSKLGDFKYNAHLILENTVRARDKKCDLLVFPELALFGYWPGDLLERKSLIKEQLKWFHWLEKKIPDGIAVVFGLVTENTKPYGKLYYNSAALVQKGKKSRFFHKELLPTYDVFDEDRYFERGDLSKNFFRFKKKKILVTICEDIWASGDAWVGTRFPKNPIIGLKRKNPDLILNLSASPYSMGKEKRRNTVVEKTCAMLKAPMMYTNMVGAQDEIIFDGGSIFMSKDGEVQMQSIFFEEDLNLIDFKDRVGGFRDKPGGELEKLRLALVTGIRDFSEKTGLKHAHLGLSGGIDSALVACLAVDALGPQNVSLIAMPGPYSADESLELAKKLSENLTADFLEFPISNMFGDMKESVNQIFGTENPITLENLQARLRAVTLMAFANERSSLLLSTSNKSEMAVGYTTLYGDMCGGLAPLGDLVKGKVFELSRHYNRMHELIPSRIIDRPPSAELRPDQKDSDSLPPYEELDRSVAKVVQDARPATSKTDKWVMQKLVRSEFKRWQAPPILRVTSHAFGRGRRYPIAHAAKK